jgi:hypothetical protein
MADDYFLVWMNQDPAALGGVLLGFLGDRASKGAVRDMLSRPPCTPTESMNRIS